MHVHPQGGENFFWAKFTGNVVSAPQTESAPPRQSKSLFFEEIGEMWTVGEVTLSLKVCSFLTHYYAHQCGILTPTHKCVKKCVTFLLHTLCVIILYSKVCDFFYYISV